MARKISCRDCRAEFDAPAKRGRPPVRCEDCIAKKNAAAAAAAAAVVGLKSAPAVTAAERLAKARAAKTDEVVYATVTTPDRAHRPRGIEAQCTRCHRVFSSDSVCEKHKYYAAPKTKDCKDPVELGLIAVEKRGIPVWIKKMEETAA